MAKPDAEITVKLDPEVMELLRDMVARIDALEAAVRRLEQR